MLYGTPSHLNALAPPVLLAKGCANVIHLEKFKAESGDRWPRICEGVYAKLENLLRGMLGPADFFARIEDTAYLVVMPTTEPEDVNVTCLRVAFDLHVSFLGQCGLEHIEVATARANPDSDGLLLEKLPDERIVALAEKAGIQLSAPAGAEPHVLHPGNPVAPERPHAPARLQHYLSAPIQVELTLEHHYVPIWSVQHNAVTSYLCETKGIYLHSRRDPIPLYALAPGERLAVEMSCFHASVAALEDSVANGRPFILAVGFSFDALGSPAGRKEFLTACHSLSHEMRQYLSFIISEVPLGVGQTRLATTVTLVKPYGRSVSATVAPQCKNLSPYQGIGLTAIGYSQWEFGRLGGASQYEIEMLSLFARRNNLLTFLAHVQDTNTLKHAQDAGINQLCGDAVAKSRDVPDGMWRLTWDKLLSGPGVEIWS